MNNDDEDICRNNHGDNPESRDAHRRVNKAEGRRLVYTYLENVGFNGATCDEIELATGLSHQTASARCSDLKKDGLIIPKPNGLGYYRRLTRSGSPAAVLVLFAYSQPGI